MTREVWGGGGGGGGPGERGETRTSEQTSTSGIFAVATASGAQVSVKTHQIVWFTWVQLTGRKFCPNRRSEQNV